MKFNMISVKFDQKIKKPKKPKFGLFRFLRFFKNLKKLGFFGAIFQPCIQHYRGWLKRELNHIRWINYVYLPVANFLQCRPTCDNNHLSLQ